MNYELGDIIQIPSPTGYRVWRVVGRHFGSTTQEHTIALFPLDKSANKQIQVPVDMLNAIPNRTNFKAK